MFVGASSGSLTIALNVAYANWSEVVSRTALIVMGSPNCKLATEMLTSASLSFSDVSSLW